MILDPDRSAGRGRALAAVCLAAAGRNGGGGRGREAHAGRRSPGPGRSRLPRQPAPAGDAAKPATPAKPTPPRSPAPRAPRRMGGYFSGTFSEGPSGSEWSGTQGGDFALQQGLGNGQRLCARVHGPVRFDERDGAIVEVPAGQLGRRRDPRAEPDAARARDPGRRRASIRVVARRHLDRPPTTRPARGSPTRSRWSRTTVRSGRSRARSAACRARSARSRARSAACRGRSARSRAGSAACRARSDRSRARRAACRARSAATRARSAASRRTAGRRAPPRRRVSTARSRPTRPTIEKLQAEIASGQLARRLAEAEAELQRRRGEGAARDRRPRAQDRGRPRRRAHLRLWSRRSPTCTPRTASPRSSGA